MNRAKIGCSSLSWQTTDGKHLLGRTCDMYVLPGSDIAFTPRGSKFTFNKEGDDFVTRYALVGFAMTVTNTPIYVDGINEHGLMGCLLFYPGQAHYESLRGDRTNIDSIYFLTYLLSNYASIDELALRIAEINLADEAVAGGPAPVHYIVSDRTGETIVIEPDVGGLSVHRQTIGVLTNSPNYLWHRENLRNYIGMQTTPRQNMTIDNFIAKPFGEGTGLIGLPGDYTPPSRFVRLAYMKSLLDNPANESAALSQMLDMFSSVTIPMGLHVNHNGSPEGTLYTSVMCSESLTYYLANRLNHRPIAISLDRLKDSAESRHFNLATHEDIDWLV